MKGKISKISVLLAALFITYVSLFKAVMVVSYIRSEGCEAVVDRSGSVLISLEGEVRTLEGVSVANAAEMSRPPATTPVATAQAPLLIKNIPCLNQSHCQVWEKPGLPASTMVTMLVSGPSYDAFYYKPFTTGTPLDEAQDYFSKRGVEGVAIAMNEAAPSCLNMRIIEVKYDHVLRWNWVH